MKTCRRLRDLFSFPGFEARVTLKPMPADDNARIVTLRRQKKRRCARTAGIAAAAATINADAWRVMCVWPVAVCMWSLNAGGCSVRDVMACT